MESEAEGWWVEWREEACGVAKRYLRCCVHNNIDTLMNNDVLKMKKKKKNPGHKAGEILNRMRRIGQSFWNPALYISAEPVFSVKK